MTDHDSIYLDNNATTALAPACVEPVMACLRDVYGNPSSKHAAGIRAKEQLEQARASVARLLNAAPAEIVFTANGTESNHLAIRGALAARPGKSHVVVSAVEHPSTLSLLSHLQAEGVRVTQLPVDREGRLDLAALERAITPDTALVSLMWANNETGVLFPIVDAARIAQSKGALFHTDAVQAAGKIPLDLAQVPVDLLSLSGHKFHAPKGVGALFVRKGLTLQPMLFGHQERRRRGGTENVPAIVGMGLTCELAAGELDAKAAAMAALRDRLESGVLMRIPGATVNGGTAPRVTNTSSVRFGELEAEAILDKLDKAGICASSGAACTAGGSAPSHVLVAMGLSDAQALATIRFSLSRYTTEAEIDHVLDVLASIHKRMTAEAA
ncbi:MAG: aminotransferase class V-fold PLP-dependent enzyme [Gammaproteobacteria bacterium]|nr:aminotransferase class V-fold PLP-dependent enzyme [Gammaproteobacteria bacterium]MBU1407730.1 aminotransferase class V-fold PLP-dependent enzyme [Gammaproteobacteria bacterium]MBU1531843.1 aminotransferase class V-fold PLP-dependent enzyme [Gammaproteobacteria bacterium]